MADEGPAAFDLAANQNKLQGISLVHLGQPQWFSLPAAEWFHQPQCEEAVEQGV